MRRTHTAQKAQLGTNIWWRKAKVFVPVSEEVVTTRFLRSSGEGKGETKIIKTLFLFFLAFTSQSTISMRRCMVMVKQTHPGMSAEERKRRVKVHLMQRVVVW